jgi:uncharacterized membrane protein YhdT
MSEKKQEISFSFSLTPTYKWMVVGVCVFLIGVLFGFIQGNADQVGLAAAACIFFSLTGIIMTLAMIIRVIAQELSLEDEQLEAEKEKREDERRYGRSSNYR